AEPTERRPDVIPPEEQVLLRPDRHARLLGVHVQDDARRRGYAAREPLGQGRERLYIGSRRHDVHHRLARVMALAQRHEAEEPRAGGDVVDGKPARPDLAPEKVEQRVNRLRLQQAPLDVEDDVVAVGLVQADDCWSGVREPATTVGGLSEARGVREPATTVGGLSEARGVREPATTVGGLRRASNRELHLVAVPVRLGGRQDRSELERAETADPLEAVAHLLLLEGELRGIGEVLKPTSAAASEVRAGRLDPVGRRRRDRLDDGAAEPRTRVHQRGADAVAGYGAANEYDV